jgi:hypothetical protein
MISYLSNYISNLPAIQTRQLLKVLQKKREDGEIRSVEEFQRQLANMVKLIGQENLVQQTPPLGFSEGDLMESDAMRTFFNALQLDLELLLGETDRLGETIRGHNELITQSYFNALEAAVNELEYQVRAYELLGARKFAGFGRQLQGYSFSTSIVAPAAQTNGFCSDLFKDYRSSQTLSEASVFPGDIGLHLGIRNAYKEIIHRFNKVEILSGSDTPQSARISSRSKFSPSRMLDGNLDTAWKQSILLLEHPSSCQIKLALSFSGARRINALALEPVADIPLRLASVSYYDSGEEEHVLDIGTKSENLPTGSMGGTERVNFLGDSPGDLEDDWILRNERKTIALGDITVSRIVVTFQQDTASDGEFFYRDSPDDSWAPISQNQLEHLTRQITESQAGSIFTYEQGGQLLRTFDYSFGLKEIYALEREYSSTGFFIPEPFEVPAVSALSLYTDTEYPISEPSDIEFVLKKENYDKDGYLLDTETFPLLSYGVSTLNERLFLKNRVTSPALDDTGVLRFYPDFDEDFYLYNNGVLLTVGVDYSISIDNGTTWESSLPPVGTSMTIPTCLVKLKVPSSSAIFYVNYTPLLSSEEAGGEIWLNQERRIRLDRYRTYVFDNNRSTGVVAKNKMGLQIILRANTLNTRVSPFLRELVILGD